MIGNSAQHLILFAQILAKKLKKLEHYCLTFKLAKQAKVFHFFFTFTYISKTTMLVVPILTKLFNI